ncbi:SusC/RagA family TonB-linked outer membrane protein [Mongoliibacter ruber]|uniref:TonB-linked SusC/RagA family outer membrane protein n=1 Tax=Mongoliibacter ruber TaxID=1750599 RepID=A0A2T0WFH1_9BACT|nr:SusC/RagA family TonB-linked outer membrane protein [Mongoliibacter ruber]PRY85458.1 TonB-linked SusC/RagA family outer membrane protein [Mongoliibacter ruber]
MENFNKILLTGVFLLLFGNAVTAQERVVSGKVTDEFGEQLIGVSLLLKGTNVGTITDIDGSYSLAVPNEIEQPIIVVSYIGFLPQEVRIGNNSRIDFTLEESIQGLSEVVITAFGVSKEKSSLGYSTQTISGDKLVKAREPSPLNALAGRVAGLTIGPSTEMLAAPNINLRGNSDILFVVDGVPINTDTWNINPDDIESITVLKGPNAAALYGFRGQNGAIQINTKRGSGREKGFSLSLNSSTQLQTSFVTRPRTQTEYGLGNSFRYAFGNDPFDRDGSFRRAPLWGPRFEGQMVPQYDSPVDPETGIRQGTPWLAKGPRNFENFVETGILTSNNVALGFNDERSDFRMSYTNSHQTSVWPNTSLNINNLNMSAGYNFTDKLRLEGNVNVNLQNAPNIPEVMYGPNSYMYTFAAYGSAHFDIRDLKDYWASPGIEGIQQINREYGRTNNPYFMANEWLREHQKTDTYGFLSLSYQANADLKFQLRSNMTNWSALRTEKLPYSAEHYSVPDRAGNYTEDRRALMEHKTDLLITYDKKVGDFEFDVLVGGNFRRLSYNSSFLSTNNLIVPGVYAFTNSENPLIGYSFRSDMAVLAGYSSIDINYKKYVTLNLTGHWDKLSTLPVGDQAYFYPSASLSTVISDYINLPSKVSFLKVRGSFAQVQGGLVSPVVGPANIALGMGGNWFTNDWFTTYDGPTYRNQNTYSTSLPYNNRPGASFTSVLANSGLQPFTVTAYETGVDMFFLDNRLGLDLTYFSTINGPQIFTRDMAPSTGFDRRNVNDIITVKNGWEAALTGLPVMKDNFKWEIAANFSGFVERLNEINDPSGSIIANGGFLRVGDRTDKLFASDLQRTPQGENIHDSRGLPLRGRSGIQGNQFIGNGNNAFVWGIQNTFNYKNWMFGIQVDGRVGGIILNELWQVAVRNGADITTGGDTPYGIARRQEWESFRDNGSVTPAFNGGGVVLVEGTPTFGNDGKINNFDQLTFIPNNANASVQDYTIALSGFDGPWTQSRTFTKLRELSIGFNFPSRVTSKMGVRNASFSLVGRNLLYWAERTDVDMDQYIGTSFRPSSDQNNPFLQSPGVRNFGFNLNISL